MISTTTGRAAGRRRTGAVTPLADAGFTKADVREASRLLGLRRGTSRPPPVASRIPYGTPVTLGLSTRWAGRSSGCGRWVSPSCRVRHYGDPARIEVPLDDLDRALAGSVPRLWQPCAPRGTSTSRSISKGYGAAISTTRWGKAWHEQSDIRPVTPEAAWRYR